MPPTQAQTPKPTHRQDRDARKRDRLCPGSTNECMSTAGHRPQDLMGSPHAEQRRQVENFKLRWRGPEQ
jgi:hypothetical protein